jgi:hypothetical protein
LVEELGALAGGGFSKLVLPFSSQKNGSDRGDGNRGENDDLSSDSGDFTASREGSEVNFNRVDTGITCDNASAVVVAEGIAIGG